jgi:Zn-dependent peptidase ImmA (M78 family)/DNA-binding Xre family transcriptional regulator
MRRGVDAFVPERLGQVLLARRMPQSELAAKVGVSAATVSKWRSGGQSPETDALGRLASAVDVQPEWFTRPLLPAGSDPLFRSNASAHVAARAQLRARHEWVQEIALGVEEFVDFPELRLPARRFRDPEEIAQADIEQAADECREMWGVGRRAIQDLTLAVEGAGIIVVREETGIAQIEGLSAWSEALSRPVILLSADKDNAFRSRFDLAHELAHLILHKHVTSTQDPARHKLMERQAHQFAGAFLLPAETFSRDVRTPCTLDDLLQLKARWGVSVAAIAMRLRALDIIDDDEKQSLFKRRSARWGAKSEPLDDSRAPESPRLLRRSIELIVESGAMPLESIPSAMGLSPDDVQSIAGLPESYFRGPARVVDLARLRSAKPIDPRPIDDSNGSRVVMFRRRFEG